MKTATLKNIKNLNPVYSGKLTSRKFLPFINSDQEDVIKHNLNTATTLMQEKKSKNKKIFNLLFLIFNLALVIGVFYNFAKEQGGIQPLSDLLLNHPRWRYLCVAAGLFILTVIFNCLKTFFLIHNRTKSWKPWLSFKAATMSKYYDMMTPFSSGGKPFEIYYLKKHGHSGDISTAIPLAKYMIWQFVIVILCTSILIFYPYENIASPLIYVCAWIGLAAVLSVFLFILFMSITKKWGIKLVSIVLKILHKVRIIKNYHTTLRKVLRFVKSYQYSMKSFTKSPFTIIIVGICTLGAIISNGLIAYFIYKTFTEVTIVTWYEIFCKCMICELAICIIPLPGGSGVSELSFNSLLGGLFAEGALFWGILIWRLFTYYFHIVLGGILLVIDMIIPKKRKNTKNIS